METPGRDASSRHYMSSSDNVATSSLLGKQAPDTWATVDISEPPQKNMARCVPRSKTDIIFTMVIDVFLILAAALFLILPIVAITLNNRPVDDHLGYIVEEAMKLGPTIFPIVFAGLVSRMLKSLARYWAEREDGYMLDDSPGSKPADQTQTLWQLMNVHTMFEAVLSPFTLREINIVPALLLLLWSLSPIGGQAVLRLVYHHNATTAESVPIRYLDLGPGGSLVVQGYYSQIFNGEVPLPVQYAFGASVLQNLDVKQGPRDNWGNVKIPRIEALNQSLADESGWIDVPVNSSSVEAYSSLMGIPIVGLPDEGAARFPLESSYISMSCDPTTVNINGSLNRGMITECLDCGYRWPVGAAPNDPRLQIFLGKEPNTTEKANATLMAPRRVTLTSGSGSTNDPAFLSNEAPINITTVTTCFVTQSLVETDLTCERGSCTAQRIRKSTTDHRNSNFTVMDHWGIWVLEQISDQFKSSDVFTQTSNMIEYFMNDSSRLPVVQMSATDLSANNTRVDFSKVPTDLLAARFSLLVNTYIQLLHAPTAFAGDLPSSELDLYGHAHIPADGIQWIVTNILGPCNQTDSNDCYPVASQIRNNTPFYGAATDAKMTYTTVVFKPDWGWVIVLMLASTTLIVTHIVGIFLSLRTHAPDVFDPVISLTYENRYLNNVDELRRVNTLRASERVRLLRKVKVRLGDVHDTAQVGKLAFGAAAEVVPIDKHRIYE